MPRNFVRLVFLVCLVTSSSRAGVPTLYESQFDFCVRATGWDYLAAREQFVAQHRQNPAVMTFLKSKSDAKDPAVWVTASALAGWIEFQMDYDAWSHVYVEKREFVKNGRPYTGIAFWRWSEQPWNATAMPLLMEMAIKHTPAFLGGNTFFDGESEIPLLAAAVVNAGARLEADRLYDILISKGFDAPAKLNVIRILTEVPKDDAADPDWLLSRYAQEPDSQIKRELLSLISAVVRRQAPERRRRWGERLGEMAERNQDVDEMKVALAAGNRRPVAAGLARLHQPGITNDERITLVSVLAPAQDRELRAILIGWSLSQTVPANLLTVSLGRLADYPYDRQIGMVLTQNILDDRRESSHRRRAMIGLVDYIRQAEKENADWATEARGALDAVLAKDIPDPVRRIAAHYLIEHPGNSRGAQKIAIDDLLVVIRSGGEASLVEGAIRQLTRLPRDKKLIRTLAALLAEKSGREVEHERVLEAWLAIADDLKIPQDDELLYEMKTLYYGTYRGNFSDRTRVVAARLEKRITDLEVLANALVYASKNRRMR